MISSSQISCPKSHTQVQVQACFWWTTKKLGQHLLHRRDTRRATTEQDTIDISRSFPRSIQCLLHRHLERHQCCTNLARKDLTGNGNTGHFARFRSEVDLSRLCLA